MALNNKIKASLGIVAIGVGIQLYKQFSPKLNEAKKEKYNSIGNLTIWGGVGLTIYFMNKAS